MTHHPTMTELTSPNKLMSDSERISALEAQISLILGKTGPTGKASASSLEQALSTFSGLANRNFPRMGPKLGAFAAIFLLACTVTFLAVYVQVESRSYGTCSPGVEVLAPRISDLNGGGGSLMKEIHGLDSGLGKNGHGMDAGKYLWASLAIYGVATASKVNDKLESLGIVGSSLHHWHAFISFIIINTHIHGRHACIAVLWLSPS